MIIFLSWSGEKSRYVADSLRTWLSDVMHALIPWVSDRDIGHGSRWSIKVAEKLEESEFGIVCVSRENLMAPWLLFEAGALAKKLSTPNVCPFLIDIAPSDLPAPLAQFQACESKKDDILKLVKTINNTMNSRQLPEDQLIRAFEKWWPDLEKSLNSIKSKEISNVPVRAERDLLEELVVRIRRMDNRLDTNAIGIRNNEWSHSERRDIFSGPDVNMLATRMVELDEPSYFGDGKAEIKENYSKHRLDGLWSTAWTGGTSATAWTNGIARVHVFHDRFYAIMDDGRADCLVAARIYDGNRLAGRYINLKDARELLPWCGIIRNNDRIDGMWTKGRWNFWR